MNTAEKIEDSVEEMDQLVPAMEFNPVEAFTDEGVEDILGKVKQYVGAFEGDMTTKKGRDEIKSFAHKITKTKTFLQAQGKELTEDWRKKTAAVNACVKKLAEELDGLRDEVRQPVIEFEKQEEGRVNQHKAMLKQMDEITIFRIPNPDAESIQARLDHLEEIYGRDWQEFKELADRAYQMARPSLDGMLEAAKAQAERDAELARMKKEAEDRERELEELRREKAAREEAERKKAEEEAKAAQEAAQAAPEPSPAPETAPAPTQAPAATTAAMPGDLLSDLAIGDTVSNPEMNVAAHVANTVAIPHTDIYLIGIKYDRMEGYWYASGSIKTDEGEEMHITKRILQIDFEKNFMLCDCGKYILMNAAP